MKKYLLILFIIIIFILAIIFKYDYTYEKKDYGVFLNIDEKNFDRLSEYKTIVIDAQYFTKDEILKLKSDNIKVYSYINIGSLENFRTYYKDYKDLCLDSYENWSEEFWVDVSNKKWQDFIINKLSKELYFKEIDGFFVDNCDVYNIYKSNKIYLAVETMLESLMEYKKDIIINGGDVFVDSYYEKNHSVEKILTGINQETIFSAIDFKNQKLTEQDEDTSNYYQNYIEKYKNLNIDIYLLEYTDDKEIIKKIKNYCDKNNFNYYISGSIELI